MSAYTPLNQEQIEVLERTICIECSKDDLELFIATCDRVQLDPFARQIYPSFRNVKQRDNTYKKVMSIQTTIDGFRIIARRSGDYQGQTQPMWCDKNGVWHEVWLDSNNYPSACKIGVHVKNYKEPLYTVARWDSYVQYTRDGKVQGMWQKMPDLMIAKCAEALSLRKALPNDLQNIYTTDELPPDSATDDEKAKVSEAAIDFIPSQPKDQNENKQNETKQADAKIPEAAQATEANSTSSKTNSSRRNATSNASSKKTGNSNGEKKLPNAAAKVITELDMARQKLKKVVEEKKLEWQQVEELSQAGFGKNSASLNFNELKQVTQKIETMQ